MIGVNINVVNCGVIMRKEDAKIRGTHPYSFRTHEWANITGVKICTPKDGLPRAAFECVYEDGVVDYIPVKDNENYEISS